MHVLEILALTSDIAQSLGVPVRDAFATAQALIAQFPGIEGRPNQAGESLQGPLGIPIGAFAALQVDRDGLRRMIEERLAFAIESVVRPQRGRPRRRQP